MKLNNETVLIVGSGPGVKLPDSNFKEIYSSNASAQLGATYKSFYPQAQHTCTIGSRSFLKIKKIKEEVVKSNPNHLIVRDKDSNINDIKILFSKKTEILVYNKVKQFFFQKNFFVRGIIDLIIAEYNYEFSYKDKLRHFNRAIVEKGFLGVSTGFFNILLAIHKNPNSKIVITGLSFEGGEHFYNSGSMSKNRGYVDKYLIQRLKPDIKNKLIFTEKKTINKTEYETWDKNYL
jgi:hypothetical protein